MPTIFAHGSDITGRSDLPIPFWLFGYMSIVALVGSVVLLTLFWKNSKLEEASKFSYEIKSRLVIGGWKALNAILRLISLALFLTVLLAALFGELGGRNSIFPVSVFIIFWVGLTFLSGILGNTWQTLSPFDTIACCTKWIRDKWQTKVAAKKNASAKISPPKIPPVKIIPPTSNINSWLAIIGLFVFLCLELVHPDNSGTRLVGFLILIYTIIMLLGASFFGRSWLREADAFSLLHRFIGSLGIFSSRDNNKNAKNNNPKISVPFTQTAQLQLTLPEVIFVIVFLGSTTFDGVTNTDFLPESSNWVVNGFGLIVTIALVGIVYFLAMFISAAQTGADHIKLARQFAHSLIPIALAYAVAHYFSALLDGWQIFLPLLSDPFKQGWDLFGTAHFIKDFSLSPITIGWVQGLSIVIGHIWGVFLAHDRALAIWPTNQKAANRSQYPLVVVMVGYTFLGLWLLLNA